MRLKLTLFSDDGSAADLQVTADPATPVGVLADHLARAAPGAVVAPEARYTLRTTGRETSEIPAEASISDAGLSSGMCVALQRADGADGALAETGAAATVRVLSGPDAGRSYPVPWGWSVIGRGATCEVRLSDPMTSRRHARLRVGELVELIDLGSVNGVQIGGETVESAVLHPGDLAELGDTLLCVERSSVTHAGRAHVGGPSVISFNRPPLVPVRYEGRSFPLPDAPSAPRAQRFPIIPLFAPLLMGAALYVTTRSITSLVFMGMSPLMMGGNVVEGQLAGKRTHRQELTTYNAALDQLEADVVSARAEEAECRREEAPSVGKCADAIRQRSPLLWSRRPDLDGFGQLRLGLGCQASRSRVEFPLGRQGAADLQQQARSRFEPFGVVDDVPVTADLDQLGGLGVGGPAEQSRALARAYVLQLVALHSHTELSVCCFAGPGRAQAWKWLQWLPHCGGPEAPVRAAPMGSDRAGCSNLLGGLETLCRARAAGSSSRLPRVLVVVDDDSEVYRSRLVELSEQGADNGIWVLWLADSAPQLPACAKTFVEIAADGTARACSVQTSQRVEPLSVEPLDAPTADALARVLSPVVDAAARSDTQSDIPRSVSLLSLVGSDLAVSADRVLERWMENGSLLSGPRAPSRAAKGRPANLRAVIGETASGPHVLDLRVHGPHALVGGTTGAGKSELLQSWIVGMALSNSPERLTFLLVDYKGGSAFSECVHLPHTVGLVTDLSPHLVRRALTSLSAELRYREHILHRKRAKDLAALERDGDPEAPPSLVIVVDEFAALVKEVPEFVDGVVNVAQRGRSLGLHLILATQRPSGVIRDNLRANTNLRIALRMADAADSSDVIGTKEAAGFDPSVPGRAASRTGPTALVPFQSGYVGGWTSSRPRRPDVTVSTLGFGPSVRWELPVSDNAPETAEGPTDIQRLVGTVAAAHRVAELAVPRKPWLPELASTYDLAKLPSARRDNELVFAVADDPDHQRQITMSFHADDDGNMAIFGTGNAGKSTLLRTLALAAGFTVRGGPCHVYGVNFGSRGLAMLEQLPHVGAVISGSDVERVGRLLAMLRELIERRAGEYAAAGAGSITEFRTISGQTSEPRILLLVDGMAGMRTAYEGTEHHRLFESFLAIAADGRPVGVHVILTADRAGAIPSALGSLIQRRVVLRLAADNDYAMLGQPVDVLDPKSPPGRGLCDGMEMQVAILGETPDLLSQDVAVGAFARAMRAAQATVAPQIGRLEEEILLEDLPVEVSGGPAFAVAGDSLLPRRLPTEGTFTVAGPPGSGRTTTLLTVATALRRWRSDTLLVYFGNKRSSLIDALNWDLVALDPLQAAEMAPRVADLLGDADEGAPGGAVIIEGLTDFLQTPADGPLQEMVRKVTAQGRLVVSDGEPTPLSGLPALLQAARASRVGIVLQPEQADGNLFKASFPRVRKADFPPGRGLFVGRGAPPVTVQVAYPGSAPH